MERKLATLMRSVGRGLKVIVKGFAGESFNYDFFKATTHFIQNTELPSVCTQYSLLKKVHGVSSTTILNHKTCYSHY